MLQGEDLIKKARSYGQEHGLTYCGALNPLDAHQLLLTDSKAILLDVRSQAELDWVGLPMLQNQQQHIHIEWAHYPGMSQNEAFLQQLQAMVPDLETPLLVLCRSANRSKHAARLASEHGYTCAIDVLEGFEGDKSISQPRRSINGWCFHQLPWISA